MHCHISDEISSRIDRAFSRAARQTDRRWNCGLAVVEHGRNVEHVRGRSAVLYSAAVRRQVPPDIARIDCQPERVSLPPSPANSAGRLWQIRFQRAVVVDVDHARNRFGALDISTDPIAGIGVAAEHWSRLRAAES